MQDNLFWGWFSGQIVNNPMSLSYFPDSLGLDIDEFLHFGH